MANGEVMESNGLCVGLQFKMQWLTTIRGFYLLQLIGLNVNLGAHWRQTLGLIS